MAADDMLCQVIRLSNLFLASLPFKRAPRQALVESAIDRRVAVVAAAAPSAKEEGVYSLSVCLGRPCLPAVPCAVLLCQGSRRKERLVETLKWQERGRK